MKKDYCIHFAGYIHSKCQAGHTYIEVARDLNQEESDWHNKNYPTFSTADTAIAKRTPCAAKNCVGGCPDFRLPTANELAKHEKKIGDFLTRFIQQLSVVRPAIVLDIKAKGKEKEFTRGMIDCPVCKTGKISYMYSGHINGHIHAKCNAEDCVSWME